MKKILLYLLLNSFFKLPVFAQGIPCNPNTFWIKGNTGGIEEFEITGSTVTSNGIIVTAAVPGGSLGFCNNLSGGAFSPTFYTSNFTSGSYYDGTAWTPIPGTATCNLDNGGGAGNYLYFNVVGTSCLNRYDGTSYTQINIGSSLVFTIADLAVDDLGNVWAPMGPASFNTDSIMVISPAGQVIKQYAFNLNTNNAYGCFMLNGILYVGLGSGNPVYPNTLLPISFTSIAAIAGTPIPFSNATSDLASCNAGNPLIAAEHNNSAAEFMVYPTMADEFTIIRYPFKKGDVLRVTDTSGKTIFTKMFFSFTSDFRLPTSSFSSGVYFITVENGKQKAIKKLVKK